MEAKTFTNRQMAAALKRHGFKKSMMQMTRNSFMYEHKDEAVKVFIAYGASQRGGVMILDHNKLFGNMSAAILTEEKVINYEAMGVFNHLPLETPLTPRLIALCVARFVNERNELRVAALKNEEVAND